MPDPVHDNLIAFNFEQNTIVSDPKPVLGRDVRQSPHIPSQTAPKCINLADDPLCDLGRRGIQALNALGLNPIE